MREEEQKNAASPAQDTLSECRLMLRFARRNSFVLTPELVHQIAKLDEVLVRVGIPPLTEFDARLLREAHVATVLTTTIEPADAQKAAAEPPPPSPTEQLLNIHTALCAVVAPATPLSLQTSEPPPGRMRLMGGMPLIVKAASILAFMSAIAFVMSVGVATNIQSKLPVKAAAEKKEADAKKQQGTAQPREGGVSK
jgi:hypothetical protein